jgi:hypothetical protein
MTAVEKYFFTSLYYPHNGWSVIGWWESRRPLFNLCVGMAGLVSLGAASVFAHLPPHPMVLRFPWTAVLLYGFLANAGYSMGSLADLLLRRWLGDRAPAVAPALFRYGFVFSLGLTLLPIPLAGLGWLFRLFS